MEELLYDIFISYSSKDREYAYELANILRNNGFSCWIAPQCIPKGASYLSCAPVSLRQSRIFLLVLSKRSQESRWVSAEVENAFKYQKTIIPYVIDDAPMKDEFNFLLSKSQRIEAYRQKSGAIEELITSIRNSLDLSVGNPHKKKKISKKTIIIISVIFLIALAAVIVSPFIGSYIAGLDDIRGEGVTYDDSGAVCGKWKWRFDEKAKRLIISGEGALPDYHHDEYKNAPWYSVADPYLGEVDLVIEKGITVVGENNFLLLSLRSITLPDTLKEIHKAAFRGNFITEITLPDGLEIIGDEAFHSCEFIHVDLPPAVKSVGEEAFADNQNLERVLIKSEVLEHIGEKAFDCFDLEEIRFIGDNPFFRTVDGALYNADGSELIYYPKGKTNKTYYAPAGLKTVRQGACDNDYLETVTLREGVTTLEEDAFAYCGSLSKVDLPDSITSMGKGVFSGCKCLTGVDFPSGMKEIPSFCFSFSGITSVSIPEGVTTIGFGAFNKCVNLTEITIPNSVTEIDDKAFDDAAPEFVIYCHRRSYAAEYAKERNLKVKYH